MKLAHERLTLLLLIICLFLVSFSSCKHDPNKTPVNRTAGQYGYVGSYLDLSPKDGYKLYDLGDVFLDNGNYCVSAVYSRYDEKTNSRSFLTDILSVDTHGKVIFTLQIAKPQVVRAVFDGEYAFFAYSDLELMSVQEGRKEQSELKADLVFFDKKTGNTTRVIHPEIKADSVFTITDGFVITGDSSIAKYASDGKLLSTIQTEFPLYPSGTFVYEDSGEIYLLSGVNEQVSDYYKVDFSREKIEHIIGTDQLSRDVFSCSGKYFFSNKGEYKVDLINMQVQTLALWNEIDIRPRKLNDASTIYVPLDDTHFVTKNIYGDGTGDIGFFSYDTAVKTEHTSIVIGGYDVYTDSALKWAVYNFNTSNKDYRLVLEDYSEEFSYSTTQEAQAAKLKLLKHFSDGHAPDIFYGHHFDFEYLGNADMVLDLVPFFEKDPELGFSDLLPSIQMVLKQDGKHSYSLFPSFNLSGYYGLRSDFANENLSLNDIWRKCNDTNKQFTAVQSSPCIAVESLSYCFQKLWGAYDNEKTVSLNELEDFVSASIELGVDPSVTWGNLCSLKDVYDGSCYLASIGPSNVFELADAEKNYHDQVVYVGYPSVKGSVHKIRPECIVGISSSTKYPDKCWEAIRDLLLPATQKRITIGGANPVNISVFDMMLQSARDPEHVTDEDMRRFVQGHSAVSEKVIEDYQSFVNSIDTIHTTDWGAYNIINEEVSSYYTQNRTVKQIAETLDSRLSLYVKENYQ